MVQKAGRACKPVADQVSGKINQLSASRRSPIPRTSSLAAIFGESGPAGDNTA
jgi:hypothetical protein